MSELNEIPRKPYYKANEVCQLTDTQPYVLRFWESEFPQLAPRKRGSGQPVYRREDIDLVLRIKKLLYDEERTIEGARQLLEAEGGESAKAAAKPAAQTAELPARPDATRSRRSSTSAPEVASGATRPRWSEGELTQESTADDRVPRQRYEDAVEEIAHLRLQVKESEGRLRRAEGRVDRALEHLESLLGRLDPDGPA